ncbi:hypothetical protein Hdeb2414_s0023g00628311 [Helianthus debilis subsp. tardiflorus]
MRFLCLICQYSLRWFSYLCTDHNVLLILLSGFLHTAFNFGHEADIQREANIDPTSVPPGALVTFVQRGIQYLEMKANLKIDDSDIADGFVFIKPFDLLNMNVEELKQNIEKNRVLQAAMNLQHLRKGKEREDSEIVGKGKEKIDDDVNYKLNESVEFGGKFLEFLRCD